MRVINVIAAINKCYAREFIHDFAPLSAAKTLFLNVSKFCVFRERGLIKIGEKRKDLLEGKSKKPTPRVDHVCEISKFGCDSKCFAVDVKEIERIEKLFLIMKVKIVVTSLSD